MADFNHKGDKMFFKHEEVKVLMPGAILTKIEDKEGREYWVKNIDLKSEVKAVRQQGKRTIKVQKKYAGDTNFLDFLRDNATIRVQLPPQSVSNFQENYRRVTGEEIDAPSEHVSIIPSESKMGNRHHCFVSGHRKITRPCVTCNIFIRSGQGRYSRNL
jgi:hypothetical protein